MSLPHLRAWRAWCAALVLPLAFSAPALAQDATVTGVVVDEASGELLIGVNVAAYPEGSEAMAGGSSTDLDGRYRITGLAPGRYDLVFSYVGFNTQRVTGLALAAGEVATLDVPLSEEAIEVGEAIVEARALRNNEAALLRDRQRAAAVSDAISAEAISQSGSSDAADAMERVTGASVIGGRYVVIRGLGDRYANTQLNSATLPTADPDRRAVQFDLFPSNFLENIVTLKTFTPDKPGNFSGGLVDISTKPFPEAFTFQLSASSGLDTETAGDGFLSYPGGGTDWLGSDDGTRGIPDLLAGPDVEIPSNYIAARRDPELAARLDQLSKAFGPTAVITEGGAPVNQSYALSVGNQHRVLGNALGYIVGLNYGRSASGYGNGFTGRYGYSQEGDDGAVILDPELLLTDARGTEEVTWGGLGNLTYRLGSRNEVGLNTLYSRGGESTARFQVGSFPEQFAGDSTALFVNRTMLYVERALYSVQLRGRHQVPALLGATVEWQGNTSNTTLDEPDLRFYPNARRDLPTGTVFPTQSSGFTGPLRYFRSTEEGLQGANLDVTVPARVWGGLAAQVKVGANYQYTDRAGAERRFRFVSAPGSPVLLEPGEDGYGDIGAFLDPRNLGVVDTLDNGQYQFGTVIQEEQGAVVQGNNYTGELAVPAAYAMAELPITSRLRAIIGARFEATRQSVTSEATVADTLGTGPDGEPLVEQVPVGGAIETSDLLPSLNLVYAVRDDMNLRLAGTRTLARPTFLEISPACRFEFALGSLVCGNPALERSLITNLDARWEWFTGPGELLAISAYYKNIDQPIERVIVDANGQQTYRNVAQADLYGIEVEGRQRLGDAFDLPVLRHLSAGLNFSLVSSVITIDPQELAIRRGIDPDAADTRALQGQSPFLVNADLAYEDFDAGTNIGVYFNAFGRRLSRVSRGRVPDIYEASSPQLDLVASQRFLRDWSVKLSVKNLLGEGFREVYDADYLGEAAIYQAYDRGTQFSVGITFNPRFLREAGDFGGGTPPRTPSATDTPVPGADGL